MITEQHKTSKYDRLYTQAESLLRNSPSRESAFATLNAILYHKIQYIFWIGFYLVRDDDLIVSAYQGPLACQVLHAPKGICWRTVREVASVIIPDVHQEADHFACDARSKSEIVLPLIDSKGKVIGVLDVDSDKLNAFTEADRAGLQKMLQLIKV